MHERFDTHARTLRAALAGVAVVGIAVATATLGHGYAATGTHADTTSPTITKEPFGTVDGTQVYRYTLTNARHMRVRILTYGGIVSSIDVPDRHGQSANVVLGFPTLQDYVTKNSPEAGGGVYFGALIGRYANRIAKGTFTLDGHTYHVPINNNGNSLHGGLVGFNMHVWTPVTVHRGHDSVSLSLRLVSPDGDQGYPGTLATTATYSLDDANRLGLHFTATTDSPTVVNLTNHTYWNLAGESSGDVYRQRLTLNADRYTPTDSTQIPTGQIVPVKGTPFDFTRPTAIGARINKSHPQLLIGQGYDHNWVLNRQGNGLSLAAHASDPASGRTLTIYTTQPGIQFYSGNFLTGTLVGTSGHTYRQSYGFALETQHYPDSPNHPNFPSTVLRPGQTYDQTTVYQLGVD
jgi:aldose 1-epimerase